MHYENHIRNIPDFPKPGIVFKDITPLLANGPVLKQAIVDLSSPFKNSGIELVVGIEARGFMFGPAVALELGCGFAPVRKPGKLPFQCERVSYALEYGTDSLEIHADATVHSKRVLIVDDVLATGGTAAATATLVEKVGGHVHGFSFLISLDFLNGQAKLGDRPIHGLISYS